ncbi:hypothetical protein SAMN05661091_0878 [Paenibacillus uliginis N3/975]|uniref:Uncharacterized protein n=1 Tax=Paenibacillus uliginis N3/975 TaxID=1313296 RepID=A0A1X7GNP8_9BACL|nr:hypothetical protein [Paenibacillus uliginis]SMF72512.1 hypothetical protein SAMN05661091_0878 [Paenibacillus uliginis N3/975]
MPSLSNYRLDAYRLGGVEQNTTSRSFITKMYEEPMPGNTVSDQLLFTIPASNNYVDFYSVGEAAAHYTPGLALIASTNGGNGAGYSKVSLLFEDEGGKFSGNMLESKGEYNNGLGFASMHLDRATRILTFVRTYKHGGQAVQDVYTIPSIFNTFGQIKVKVRHTSNPASTNKMRATIDAAFLITT